MMNERWGGCVLCGYSIKKRGWERYAMPIYVVGVVCFKNYSPPPVLKKAFI